MAIRQTRRAVSMSASTYDKLKELSRLGQCSMAVIVDRLVRREHNDRHLADADVGAVAPGQEPPA